jgi:hypothetical protein
VDEGRGFDDFVDVFGKKRQILPLPVQVTVKWASILPYISEA